MTMFMDVAEFHKKILSLPFPAKPVLLDQTTLTERMGFLREELNEFYDAHEAKDIVGATDGLLDLIYVALGTLYQMGMPADRMWQYVQEANMAKRPGVTARGYAIDAVKPIGWVGPEAKIKAAIEELQNATKSE